MQDGVLVNDPYEAQNRSVHNFNKSVDRNVIAPVGNLLRSGGGGEQRSDRIGARDAVINVGSNLSLPGKVVNSVLQGRPEPAIKNLFRFAVNSTIGIAGIFDPAGEGFGLPEQDTDFGETLAVWGIPEGTYVELPLIGPSTQRDAAGRVVDIFIDPLNHVLNRDERMIALGLRIGSKAGERARFGDTVDSILQDSADSYAQTRLIYLMHRRHELGETRAEIDPYADADADAGSDVGADEGVIDPYEE
ncbi:VacJ family lipoprotein [Paracoccus caeni]|uniref:VacJ family lipoprotein n=2 Tax=Paracoccus caeni TaxID=657651 RepID=A0A934W056_9RHOB|nr:VacJ family lipoprotein [Paracoccus caeni]